MDRRILEKQFIAFNAAVATALQGNFNYKWEKKRKKKTQRKIIAIIVWQSTCLYVEHFLDA